MIERHLTFTVDPANADAFERFMTDEYGPAMARSPGFVRLDLLREADDRTRYQLAFRFSDAGSAAGWRTSTVHQALQPALQALHRGMVVQGYDVIA